MPVRSSIPTDYYGDKYDTEWTIFGITANNASADSLLWGTDGQDLFTMHEELAFVFNGIIAIWDAAREKGHGAYDDLSASDGHGYWKTALDARNPAALLNEWLADEGGGMVFNQIACNLPPIVVDSDDLGYGFLDPTKPFVYGNYVQLMSSAPTTLRTYDFDEMADSGVGSAGTMTYGEFSAELGYSYEYTTRDLGGGWTWHAGPSHADHFYANALLMEPEMIVWNKTACTMVYESIIVNWYDSTALDLVLESSDGYSSGLYYDSPDSTYDYGGMTSAEGYGPAMYLATWKGKSIHDFTTSVKLDMPSWEDYDGTVIPTVSARDMAKSWYGLTKIAENIAFQSEESRAISLVNLASVAPDGISSPDSYYAGMGDSFIGADPFAATDADAHKYASWPWPDGESSSTDSSDGGDSFEFTMLYQGDDSLIAKEMSQRWRVAATAGGVFGENFWFSTRIAGAVTNIANQLNFPDLPMKFIIKTQPTRKITDKTISAFSTPSDTGVSTPSDTGGY